MNAVSTIAGVSAPCIRARCVGYNYRCECTLYSCSVRMINAVYTIVGVSARGMYKCRWHLVINVHDVNAVSRYEIVRARRVRFAERITRQRGGARPMRGAIGPADWLRRTRRARRTRCREISICVRGGSVACSVQRGLCNGLGLESRVLSAEIEYARSRYLVQVKVDRRILREQSTLGGDRVLSIPVSRKRFGQSKSRVRSAEIFRSRYLRCGFRESSTLDGDRVLSVPKSLLDC